MQDNRLERLFGRALDNALRRAQKTQRALTPLEALFDLYRDHRTGRIRSIAERMRRWGWSRYHINELLEAWQSAVTARDGSSTTKADTKPDPPYPSHEAEAVRIYVHVCKRRPSAFQADLIARRVGRDTSRLDVWRTVCETWAATHEPRSGVRPYNLGNVQGMLMHFEEVLKGGTSKNNAGASNKGAVSESSPEALSRYEMILLKQRMRESE